MKCDPEKHACMLEKGFPFAEHFTYVRNVDLCHVMSRCSRLVRAFPPLLEGSDLPPLLDGSDLPPLLDGSDLPPLCLMGQTFPPSA